MWTWLALLPSVYIWLALVEGQDKANEYGNTVFQPTKWEYVGVFCTIVLCTLPLMILSSYATN